MLFTPPLPKSQGQRTRSLSAPQIKVNKTFYTVNVRGRDSSRRAAPIKGTIYFEFKKKNFPWLVFVHPWGPCLDPMFRFVCCVCLPSFFFCIFLSVVPSFLFFFFLISAIWEPLSRLLIFVNTSLTSVGKVSPLK